MSDTNDSSEIKQKIGLRVVKTTVLEEGIESVRYEGVPLSSNFSIKDVIEFYLKK